MYADTASRLVTSVIEGYNATMFAYGQVYIMAFSSVTFLDFRAHCNYHVIVLQTGCGKTHTMEGKPNPPELRGIIPNSFDHIFDAINSNTVKGKKFLVKASYIEVCGWVGSEVMRRTAAGV